MDYRTKATSRKQLRKFALFFRKIFDVPNKGAFPVLEALEKIPDIFEGSSYQIVEDEELPPKIMAQCSKNEEGGFTIEIKKSVYECAYNQVGACLGFICHELCHVFLFHIGFTPIFARCITEDEKIPAYCSVEWQAKALCAEVMIPYDESKGMKRQDIINMYHVSKAFADKRVKLERK